VLAVVVASLTLGQAVAAVQVPRARLGSATPADRGLAHHDVWFRTSDGVRLSGWYVESRNGAAVALLHGAHSTRSAVLDHAVVLSRRGFGVLLFDARGHGRSAGRAMEFGWYGDEDVSAAVSFLVSQPDVRGGRVGVVGMSMGGEEAIGAAAADARVRAVVAEGATNRVAADKAWLSEAYGRRGDVQRGLEWVTYGATDLLTPASPPISLRDAVASAAPRPFLLIAAGARPDEGTANRHVATGSPGTVEVWEVAGATHTGGLRTRPPEWERRVTTFLAAALDAAPPRGVVVRPSHAATPETAAVAPAMAVD
jgi:dienelactone hydrolase